MIKIFVVVVVLVIAAVLIIARTRADSFRVQRSVRIRTPAENIFPLINDIHQWSRWSPYEKLDPAMKRKFGGAPQGVGATYEWLGNSKAGQGRMEIIESTPPTNSVIDLRFIKPFKAHNVAQFALQPQGDATEVTWSIEGPSPLMTKVVGLSLNMDRLIGKDFESGLADLKAAAEG